MSQNRLTAETSPYLLQHAHNPVHWWAWGPEALAEAQAQDKPILLSVGYSACHWCHVMAHESFEDPGIAALMNDLFINIKVDREERPDLDALYQQALGLMGQHGGWPLTMFLTPRGEPFWGGTYFPATARYGRAAFPDVLEGISHTYHRDPTKVSFNVEKLRETLAALARSPGAMGLDMEIIDRGARECLAMIDFDDGGTLGAPKFPQPGLFRFLWRSYLRNGDERLKQAVTLTLDHIAQGGIYDHLGGGFMRYSTDQEWLVPHFEKMLYDNAQLLSLSCQVWRETRSPLLRARVFETVGWLLREMLAEGGAFAAALDADSDGEEGLFYTWTADEIEALLGKAKAAPFARLYDVRPHGNWEGRTILHRNHPNGAGDDEALTEAKAILLAQRETRIRPGRDHKVLTDWNGMMIAALAEAATTFDRPDWLAAAKRAFTVVVTHLARPDGRLFHSLCQGRAAHAGMVDDYAHMARAAMALVEAGDDPSLLDHARQWLEAAHRHHWDQDGGGYFLGPDDAADVMLRTKPSFDSAMPSGNGAMAEALALMTLMTGETHWRDRAEAVVAAFSAAIPDQFGNMTALLDAFELLTVPCQVVVVGEPAQALLTVLAETSAPPLVVLRVRGDEDFPTHHPAYGKGAIDGKATAYVCHAGTCSAPVTDPVTLRALLA